MKAAFKEWLKGSSEPRLLDDGSKVIRARDTELPLWETIDPLPPSGPNKIYLQKGRRFLSALAKAVDQASPKRIVEIGILNGGSTIYWAERYNVDRLIAFELSPQAPFLTQYLERHGLTEKVRVHFGISQGDKIAVRNVLLADLAGSSIDAVIDDASHWLVETKTAFETIFPFVRSGGVYVIEDWAWGHHKDWPAGLWGERPLMSPLLTELVLICGKGDGIIDHVDIDSSFAVIRRGNAPIATDGSFTLAKHYVSRGFAMIL